MGNKGYSFIENLPRNLKWSMIGTSIPSSLSVRSLCIFLSCPKCTHRVFLMAVLKLFLIAHWLNFSILFFAVVVPQLMFYFWILIFYRSRQHRDSHEFQDSGTCKCRWLLGWRVSPIVCPLRDPSFWLWKFDWVDPIWTQNLLFERKFLMKLGSLPRNLIPYFQVVPCLFSLGRKKICSQMMFLGICLTYTGLQSDIIHCWSLSSDVALRVVIRLLDSINRIDILMTINSMVLQKQLVKAIGR